MIFSFLSSFIAPLFLPKVIQLTPTLLCQRYFHDHKQRSAFGYAHKITSVERRAVEELEMQSAPNVMRKANHELLHLLPVQLLVPGC